MKSLTLLVLSFLTFSFVSNDQLFSQDDVIYPPLEFQIFRGITLESELEDFIESDNVRSRFNPFFLLNNFFPISLIFDGVVPEPVNILVEANANTPGTSRYIEAFNFVDNSFELIDQTFESFNKDTVTVHKMSLDHISTDGEVVSRINWGTTGFILLLPWEVRVDQVGWTPAE